MPKMVQNPPWPEDTDEKFVPTLFYFKWFDSCIDWEAGVGDDGQWMGRCPLGDDHGATFSFVKGVLRCQGEPACHAPKRAMSLGNVIRTLSTVQ